jgi:hypothetical protein
MCGAAWERGNAFKCGRVEINEFSVAASARIMFRNKAAVRTQRFPQLQYKATRGERHTHTFCSARLLRKTSTRGYRSRAGN